jgi:hypothetical protein
MIPPRKAYSLVSPNVNEPEVFIAARISKIIMHMN